MTSFIIRVYTFVFARECFVKWNQLLFRFSIRGLGVLNYQNSAVSGEKTFLEKYLGSQKGGDVVIDIGANHGEYSKKCFEVNPALRVYAFEPHPKTFKALTENLESTGTKVINKAMGAEVGTLDLYDYAERDGSSHASLYKDVIEGIHGKKSVSHHVDVSTVDHFVFHEGIEKIALLKIDVEGHELDVLAGAVESIRDKKIRAIHFEFNEMNVVSRTFFKDFADALDGYEFFRLLPNGMLKLGDYSPLYCEIFGYQNIVAFPR